MNYKNSKSLLILLISFCFVAFPFFYAKAMDGDEATAYANFIRDLVRATYISKHGVFCIVGSDEVTKVITSQDRNVVILSDNSKKYNECNAVYVAQGRERGLRIELATFAANKILTIAIFDDFTEMGGMLQIQLGRRNFELIVNSKLLKNSGVKLGVLATGLIIN